MLMIYQKDGISIYPALDKRKRRGYTNPDPKNPIEVYKIKIRIVYQGKPWEYNTGKMITEFDWINELERSKAPKMREIRKDLLSSFDHIKKHVQELAESGNFNFENLNNRLKNRATDSLNDLFTGKIEALEAEGREGSRLYYDNVLKNIVKFKGKEIPIKAVNVAWLKEYEKHLLAEDKKYTTVGIHMRAIRTILNAAKATGTLKAINYPFGAGRYEIPTGKGRKMALTINQIKQIMDYSEGNPKTDFYRDLWIFSYLCNGINFADLIQLKFSNIRDGEIEWLREKTKRTTKEKAQIQAFITPEMESIIKRWGNEPNPKNYIFPILEKEVSAKELKLITKNIISHCNQRMKRIGKALKIGNISTYTARHSYATVLKRSGANIAFISESLGHNDLKTTENYLASFEKDERKKNASLLTQFPAEEKAAEETPANETTTQAQ